ncbi:MAG: hypothetical protein IIC78_02090 [Chloroflexi bacterium]|nr:hypothetical protein [Chloroflexota bacterium]
MSFPLLTARLSEATRATELFTRWIDLCLSPEIIDRQKVNLSSPMFVALYNFIGIESIGTKSIGQNGARMDASGVDRRADLIQFVAD